MSQEDPKSTLHLTELGNAKRLVQEHGKDIRFVAEWKDWVFWDGQRWKRDTNGAVPRKARSTIEKIRQAAACQKDLQAKERLERFADRSETARSLSAMVKLAQAEEGVTISAECLDRDSWLFNVENGTVDLRTGSLGPHQREDLISHLAPIRYEATAKSVAFEAFMDQIFGSNPELVDFVQKAIGYSLTGLSTEQCLFLLYGTGANGKSTLMQVFRTLFGSYGKQSDFSTFTQTSQYRVRDDIARLRGARLILASEADSSTRLSESTVKQMTGGDAITARELYGKAFEFIPQSSIWLAANSKPSIRGGDHAIWRRIRLIPFHVTFSAEEQDRNLCTKLLEDGSGILNWMVQGCLAWQKDSHLDSPAEVIEATQEYRQEMDLLAGWMEECCTVGLNRKVWIKDVNRSYETWCEANREQPVKKKNFTQMLLERGFLKDRSIKGGRTGWKGFDLKPDRGGGVEVVEEPDVKPPPRKPSSKDQSLGNLPSTDLNGTGGKGWDHDFEEGVL